MTDFDFDCKEKKIIARGAYHKKNGSKSKGCSLPHDGENPKKLNGPVKTVTLDRPMEWKEFRAMAGDQQRMYLERCMDLYGASAGMLAQMFGVTPTSVGTRLRALGVKPRSRTYQPSKEQRAMWAAFCGGVVGGQPGEPKPEPALKPEPTLEEKVEQKTQALTTHRATTIPVSELDALRQELEFYKRAYNELLDRLTGVLRVDKAG